MVNIIKKIRHNLKQILNWQLHVFKFKDKPLPVYSNYSPNGIKLHIGAGEINLQGWINIDARKYDHTHLLSNEIKLSEFNDGTVQEIYLCHVLEHFSFCETNQLIDLFFKKLKKGGILRLAVPSFDSLIEVYKKNNNDIEKVKYALMGGQDYEYNFHKSVYNFNEIKKILEKQKFVNIVKWETKSDFGNEIGDWSSGKFKTKDGYINISLNVKAVKM